MEAVQIKPRQRTSLEIRLDIELRDKVWGLTRKDALLATDWTRLVGWLCRRKPMALRGRFCFLQFFIYSTTNSLY